MVQEPPLLQWPAQVEQLGATRPSEQLRGGGQRLGRLVEGVRGWEGSGAGLGVSERLGRGGLGLGGWVRLVGRGWRVGTDWGVGPTHLQVTSPLCLLTTQAPSRQRLHLFTSHLGPSK